MTQTPQHPPMTYEQLKQSHDEWRMLAMHNYGVAKAAEAREQQLKEAVQLAVNDLGLWGDKTLAAKVVLGQLQRVVSTLYPDTPAPKEGE
ncbi:hypothetical protein NST48_01535 [Paenibacillus sp. FSL M7-0547]|uniref:hypothetical protein n=1 Tax=Paenibacillus sp. FSL M7-0547 TaxID=2954755 RepID=UPI0030F7B3AF